MSVLTLSRQALAAAVLLALATRGDAAAPALRTLPLHTPHPDTIQSLREDATLLVLQAGAFDPLRERIAFPAGRIAPRPDARYGIVQYHAGQAAGARDAIARAGAAIVGHLPNTAFQVRGDAQALARIGSAPAVRWTAPYEAGLKLATGLLDGSVAARHAPSARVALEVHGFRGEAAERLVEVLRATGLDLGFGTRAGAFDLPSVRVDVHPAQLDALLQAASSIEGVAWIEPYLPATTHNRDSIGPIQANRPSCATPDAAAACPDGLDPARAPLWQRGLTGHGQIVAIADSGLDRNEGWFAGLDFGAGATVAITDADDPAPGPLATGAIYPDRKVYAYWVQPGASAYDNNQLCGAFNRYHGTHVTGTVLGDAAPYAVPGRVDYGDGDGMAPGAQVLFQDLGEDVSGCLAIADFGATVAQAYAGGAGIHNDSWGNSSGGYYVGHDVRADAALWAGENLLVVAAAGNSGPSATTTGSPANAKNVLAVGSTQHGHQATVSSFSSRGPTMDGRRKPDLMAPGDAIVSALGNDDNGSAMQAPQTQALSGTSMAAPTVSGGAALLRQYFSDGWYPAGRAAPRERSEPAGTLLKAALINGAAPISTSWPSHNVGWGRIWLENSLYFQGATRGLRHWVRDNGAGLESGDADAFTVTVAAGEELRATLAWFDPEAALAASPALVNDLDLVVVAPDGRQYLGNVFYAGQSATGGMPDRLNTVEHVRVIAPAPGQWTLRVAAHDIPGNGRPTSHRQGYALVVGARMGVLGDRLLADGFGADDAPGVAAPAALDATGNGEEGVRIAVQPVAGAEGYQLYRADGSCAAADPGRFRFAGQSATTSLLDTRSQGGQTYAYRVRAVKDGAEGPLSDACVDVVSADACSMSLDFDGGSLAAASAHATCAVDLSWQTAFANCPGKAVAYRVLRDTTPLFTAPQVVATVDLPAYRDGDVADGQPRFYQVEAFDEAGNASRSHIIGTTPSGTGSAGVGVWIDDADTRTTLRQEWPWSITNAAAAGGSFSYRSASGPAYPADTCAAIATLPVRLAAGTPRLRYAARYQLEWEWDGVVVELSADGGTTWTPLIPDGGYPGSFAQTMDPPANACGYPSVQGAFNGESAGFAAGQFVEISHDLGAYAGQDVQLRWRLSSDPASQAAGFFLDDVRIDAELPGACQAGP
ncbi:MAG TPA: S8 family serine peptidase [Dokdonella sp.]|uniref:S8 family serine peptidase n=1 Tax=Dokdonella sp. TaxID=2291710 RepID=UPI002CC3373B|nr:S8 family serine peptidase [Dokdonella sp.]HUD41395.1 S8 family serine peptidase [Dokdonella sp.]